MAKKTWPFCLCLCFLCFLPSLFRMFIILDYNLIGFLYYSYSKSLQLFLFMFLSPSLTDSKLMENRGWVLLAFIFPVPTEGLGLNKCFILFLRIIIPWRSTFVYRTRSTVPKVASIGWGHCFNSVFSKVKGFVQNDLYGSLQLETAWLLNT